jgi:two-component system KDP operon response regulator KdpE
VATDGQARVLVIDDEAQIRRLLAIALSRAGYEVTTVGSGAEGIERLALEPFDLLLLDLGLPDMDGVDVCRQVREWSSIPIIVISVREGDRDKIGALDLGADDYVTKPFSIGELLARIRASLRRISSATTPQITLGDLTVDLARRVVTRQGERIHLTPTEYDLLRVLALHAGRVLTHRQLLREARGPAYESETPLLRTHMAGLRQKLAMPPNSPGYIATEPGVGYRLQD